MTWPTSVTPPSQLWLVCFSRQLGPSEKTHVGWPLDPLISAQLICYIALRTPSPPQPRCVLKQTCWMEQCCRTPPPPLTQPSVTWGFANWIELDRGLRCVCYDWQLGSTVKDQIKAQSHQCCLGWGDDPSVKKAGQVDTLSYIPRTGFKGWFRGRTLVLVSVGDRLPFVRRRPNSSRLLFDNFRLHNFLKKRPGWRGWRL